jgi:hypothetical protein
MDRILPLPKAIRNSLIDLFCLAQGRIQTKAEAANKDCFIRPLLGRLKHGGGERFFSCRNFKLHANQMEQLHLESKEFVASTTPSVSGRTVHLLPHTLRGAPVTYSIHHSFTGTPSFLVSSVRLSDSLPSSFRYHLYTCLRV